MWAWLCVFRSSPRLWHSESFRAEGLTKELTKDEQDQKQKKVLLNKKGDE